jgi:hypothetical protein
LFRALRLEHDPQPGLKRLRLRTAVVSSCRKLSGGHSADIRMSLKGVGRSAKAPWRQAEWLLGGPLSVPLGETGFKRSPDARTRQIQIRNRQQHLHTAGEGEWQAKEAARGDLPIDPFQTAL